MEKTSIFETLADIFNPEFLLIRQNVIDNRKPKEATASTPANCEFEFTYNPDSDHYGSL